MIPHLRLTAALACLLALAPLAAARAAPLADSTTTILLVRHAEKDTLMVGADPPLSAAGILRAQELARVLGDTPIAAIYVTPYQRNRQTAQPLATRLGRPLTVVNAVDSTIVLLRTQHYGQTVLVVGHSNTLPQIIEALSGEKIPPFTEGDFDRLYVLTLAPRAPGKVLALHYGAGKPR
jgi:broad specificity phosphatase PhoE